MGRKDRQQQGNEDEAPLSNGADGDVETVREPKSLYGLVWFVVEKNGLSAVMILLMAAFIWLQGNAHKETAKQAHDAFREALTAQTAAMKESVTEQRKMTEAVIRLDGKIEAHMKQEENRHHR